MRRLIAWSLAAGVLGFASPALTAAPNGDAILQRAAGLNRSLQSFTVPVHFDVAVHKVFSFKVGVDGTNYFRAPDQEALVITKTPPLIGGGFKGNYSNLVTLPQVWPGRYKVQGVSNRERDGQGVYELLARPRGNDEVDHVVFDVTRFDLQPVWAAWYYRDGSTITITISNGRVDGYTLPSTENIVVSMPSNHFEATAHYGPYSLNAPVPASVFVSAAK